MTAQTGNVNKHGQKLIKKTDERGNHPYAKLWILQCLEPDCGLEYEANKTCQKPPFVDYAAKGNFEPKVGLLDLCRLRQS